MLDRAALQAEGIAVFKFDDGPVHSYPYDTPWLSDDAFTRVYNAIRVSTLVDRVRCYHLWRLAHQALKVPGAFLEVGTWRGGTAALLALAAKDRTVYVADTFAGVVKASRWEHDEDGAHADTTIAEVQELFRRLEIEAVILEGIFPDVTGRAVLGPLALVHIDVDVYQSARLTFNAIWPMVSRGGLAVFDDYGFISACGGIHRFVEEIAEQADLCVVTNLNGQAVLVKR